jgi:dTDP-4-dehydrorhamnose reductase
MKLTGNDWMGTAEVRKSPARVVLVGSDGRLGSALFGFLKQDHTVIPLGRNQLNLACERSIADVLEELDYEFLFLTGALTGVDYCETHKQEAFAVNAEAPGRIAEISARKGAHVTYVSTDMVFDGDTELPYIETDKPGPISVYGESKLKGEEYVLDAAETNLIVRVSWVFGPGRRAFPEWIVDQACSYESLTLPADKIACPSYTLDLASWMATLVFGGAVGSAGGIFHLCNSIPCTWQEWGQFCVNTARALGQPVMVGEIGGVPLDSVTAFVARRPRNSSMNTGKFTRRTGILPRSWGEAVHDFMSDSIRNRSDLSDYANS